MFVQPCTTGSQLRKAISHIFGRNKLCTKSIPSHIWVHYCRKHYQRSRYRNATDYALRQVDLVLVQINKVQEWSDQNIKYNLRGNGVLKHWTLQARKREAKRLQDSESRKRRFEEDDDDDQDGGSGTAIPNWLQPYLNQDYNTTRMLEIVQEIRQHMTNGDINQIPDIEILPEIMTDGNESRPKATTRRPSAAGHRKTQSTADIYRTPSRSVYNSQLGAYGIPQDHKRMRGANGFFGMQTLPHRPVMGMPPQGYSPYGMQQGSSFAAIAENQADPSFWTNSYNNSVLPQPVSQRSSSVGGTDGSNMAQYPTQGRPTHARSMSENPMRSGYGSSDFRFPPQGYAQPQQDMFGGMNMQQGSQYGYQTPTSQTAYSPYGINGRNEQDYYTAYQQPAPTQDWNAARASHHARVQSQPAIHQQHGSVSGGPPGMLPSMHHQQQQMYPTSQHGYNDFQQSGRF